MGPRRFRRGCSQSNSSIDGSIASLQWGRDVSVADVRPRSSSALRQKACFNGAATFPSRMLELAIAHRAQGEICFNGAATFPSRMSACSVLCD